MSDKHEPELETTRLLLRPMPATDIDDLLCIFTDRKVMAAFDNARFDRQQMHSGFSVISIIRQSMATVSFRSFSRLTGYLLEIVDWKRWKLTGCR